MIDSKTCDYAYPGMITDAMICFETPDTCIGQGVPVECNGELQGIFSWDYPDKSIGVFTKICLFNDWLERTMAS